MFFIVGTNRNPNTSLSTGSSWKGLTSAERAEKELAESQVADGRLGWEMGLDPFPSLPFPPFLLCSLPFLRDLSSPHRRLVRLENLLTV